MKWVARIIAIPIGLLVGAFLWGLLYLSFFESISIFPLTHLFLKLSPGMVIGAMLAFYVPGLFIWFLSWELGGDVDVMEFESTEKTVESASSNEKGNRNT